MQVTSTGLIKEVTIVTSSVCSVCPSGLWQAQGISYYVHIYIQSSPNLPLLIKFSAFKGKVLKLQRKYDLSVLVSVVKKKKIQISPSSPRRKKLFSIIIHFPILSSEHLQAFLIQIIEDTKWQKTTTTIQLNPSNSPPAPNHSTFRKFLLCLPLM